MLKSEHKNGVLVYSFDNSDKFNAPVAESVKSEIASKFLKPDAKVVFNLKGINYIDSSGFGTLLTLLKRAKTNYGCFRICNVSDQVMELFRLLQLHNIFEIFGTEEECINSFS